MLFDMDGTLFDSEPLSDVSLAELAGKLGGTVSPRTRHRVVGRNLRDTARIDTVVCGDEVTYPKPDPEGSADRAAGRPDRPTHPEGPRPARG
ncbi:hypothetical protein E1267_22550 [Nonomuraea longispora]|uniref:HAD family hydrolase n=1 Tax=Nonomuraea longispora TaxID=1848320 RepID=A0A4V2XJZ4_9ACTN|nr:hypothetical protein [Nonomuraea longispora]TDC04516.1 hypothetical protein E1267_22550 [Nonomuraea longispora]